MDKTDPKLWAIVTILVAVVGCIGVLGASLIGILPELLRPSTPIAGSASMIEATNTAVSFTNVQPTNTPIRIVNTPLPTTAILVPDTNPQQVQCEWLQDNFPQTFEEVRVQFGFPSDTTVNFIYELCPSIANGFAFKANDTIELHVPNDGCIDSWAGFTEYVGDVGTPIPDGAGGWRIYKGTVRAPEMTYRIMGCK